MRFHVLTIFPALFPGPLAAGVVGRALEAHTISLEVHDVRDYARDPHRQVDDEQFGQRLKAFVVPKPGAELTADDVKAHVKSNLARFKVPREVEFLERLPRNATGKVLKRELRTRFVGSDKPAIT